MHSSAGLTGHRAGNFRIAAYSEVERVLQVVSEATAEAPTKGSFGWSQYARTTGRVLPMAKLLAAGKSEFEHVVFDRQSHVAV